MKSNRERKQIFTWEVKQLARNAVWNVRFMLNRKSPGQATRTITGPSLSKPLFWNLPVWNRIRWRNPLLRTILPAPCKLCVKEFSHAGGATLSHTALRCVIYVFSVQKAPTLLRTKATTLFDCVVVAAVVLWKFNIVCKGWRWRRNRTKSSC